MGRGSPSGEKSGSPRSAEKHSLADAEWTELDGDGFRFLATFPDRGSYQTRGCGLRDAHALHIALPTASRQFLTTSGLTLFKGMAFDDAVPRRALCRDHDDLHRADQIQEGFCRHDALKVRDR
jgi:hypothetical protein